MPTYEYRCNACDHYFEKIMTISKYRVEGESQICPNEECKSSDTRRVMTSCNFNLVGEGWPGKKYRVANQMASRQEKLRPRQEAKRREEPGVRLAPNVDGQRVDSWAEAQRLAASKGKDTSTYEPLIQKERKQ